MKLLVILVLPLALVYAVSEKQLSSLSVLNQPPSNEHHPASLLGTKKEKRGIFGLGAYAPAAPIYGHGFAHHAHHLLPQADALAPVAFEAPALPPLAGPYLGSHAHTHTVVTKKVGVPVPVKVHVPVPVDRPYPVAVPKPYAVPVDRPYPVPVDRPFPVAVPHPVPVPVVKHVGYPVPFAVPKPIPVPLHTPVVVEKPVIAAVGTDPWANGRLW
ncbi:anti-sigma-I factor RsgI2-like [Anopheles albimanus]|uniref:Uncharacterized protein n=1 Tax=Anopheles albimanus TaxID=7167 RepID=A0A8W7JGG5_ANOAL|nr:anti-sigma-I factor RsgI2-like [Anopheles albimanus]